MLRKTADVCVEGNLIFSGKFKGKLIVIRLKLYSKGDWCYETQLVLMGKRAVVSREDGVCRMSCTRFTKQEIICNMTFVYNV